MLVIRPLQMTDLDDLHQMASAAGKGLTSLPADTELLEQKIQQTRATFEQACAPEAGLYLFALEDTESQRCVGISGIQARVGLDEVFYNYRLSTTVNASKALGVHVKTPTLHLTNDMTGATEIGSLLLSESYRKGGNGLLLSRCRFMYLDDFHKYFADKVFAEMRGVSDEKGLSPLWDALGSRFFDMKFSEADYLTGVGSTSFIAELMPKYPIYVPLLAKAARSVIGQVHDNTVPALTMLQAEGFTFNGLVDIFDGGPVVEAFLHNIRTVRESANRHVLIRHLPMNLDVPPEERVMVSNRSFRDFRVTTVPTACISPDTISLSQEIADQLRVESGDAVRLVRLKERARADR